MNTPMRRLRCCAREGPSGYDVQPKNSRHLMCRPVCGPEVMLLLFSIKWGRSPLRVKTGGRAARAFRRVLTKAI
jgi:hypothetical protein